MTQAYDSVIVRTVAKVLVPFIQVFALYVVFHGAKSPGGGFQGGAILAASLILLRLTVGPGISDHYLPGSTSLRLGAVGVLIYGAVGLVPMALGAAFLDYGALPVPLSSAARHALGIELVEIGVALAVSCIMISIFDNLAPQLRPADAPVARAPAGDAR
jgi:multicomponent Na+:H+ antiporter subunit B